MIVSVNWLKKFTSIDLPIDELATLIGARLVEIEKVIDLGAKYKDVIVARVVSCEPVADSDHLNLCIIDDNGIREGVERNADGLVQVVCGAPNVRAGLMVAWLPPRAIVPETYNTTEPFELGARKLRGFMSNGMLASAKELDLFEDHTGIIELDTTAAAGAMFADVYELNDYLFDIENKSLTHRPDTFGIIGFAREVAAIQGNAFRTPDWMATLAPEYGEKQGDIAAPTVTIDNPALSDRYQAVIVAGADGSAQSPLYIQTYLARVGVRPINAIVDVTNCLMMLTGQPLHAFDYDKVIAVGGGTDIHVRAGRSGEKLELLDGRTIELTHEDIVIAAGETAIGLAGAMGGAATEIDANTKNIIIESATFNLYNLRATQMRHGIFSEAITRFTKGQPAALTAPVLADAVRLMGEWAGAVRVSDVADTQTDSYVPTLIRLPISQINDTLGTELSLDETMQHLVDAEFTVGLDNTLLDVTVPYWRADMHIAEDVIEEVGRLGGFDLIQPTMPQRTFRAVMPTTFDDMRRRIRAALVRAGANEVLTYSFVHGDMLRKVNLSADASYRIINSISPDLQYYRQTLTPSLLNLVHGNSKNGYDGFALFELNKVHSKALGMSGDVPTEAHHLALVVAEKKLTSGTLYYQAKVLLEYMADQLGLTFAYEPLTATDLAIARPFEPKRSAEVREGKSGEILGVIGEYRTAVAKSFKLPYVAGFELDTEALMRAVQSVETSYAPLSRYPGTERDICFQVTPDTSYAAVAEAAGRSLQGSELLSTMTPIDIYQPDDGTYKNITLRFSFVSHDHTLNSDEVAPAVEAIVESVVAATSAAVI
jgi:phenylalanyl-tRNA synthetase beta chain